MSDEERDACLFCRIADGKIPATILFSTDEAVAFRDVNPQAPIHALIIPKAHIEGINAAGAENGEVLASLIRVANQVAREQGIAASGYRLVWNVGPDAGQSVFHLHLHLLGGRPMAWPPG